MKKCKYVPCKFLPFISVRKKVDNIVMAAPLLSFIDHIHTNSPQEDTWCRLQRHLALIKATMEEMPTCEPCSSGEAA